MPKPPSTSARLEYALLLVLLLLLYFVSVGIRMRQAPAPTRVEGNERRSSAVLDTIPFGA